MSENVRVRFAPSPTGELHLGNVRTALYNWLYAKHHGGILVLRIEDTDKERSTEEYCQNLMGILRWLGLDWDEGPQVGGPYAPYRQSERTEIYREHLKKLDAGGHLYPCFCSEDELDLERKTQMGRSQMPKYSGKCLRLSKEDVQQRLASAQPHVMRFHVPAGEIVFNDEVRGEVNFPDDQIGDFVLTRTDGSPTYNFTVVVDDALMKITHVLRGEDHLSNTPKQLLIYKALGYQAPKFAHLSLLKGSDGQKLSKRHGETSVESYKAKGYIPEAFLNYITLLGYAPVNGEVQSLTDLAKEFELNRVHKSGAIFDVAKLRWMGNQYLSKMDLDELTRAVLPYLDEAGVLTRTQARDRFEWLRGVVDTVRTHLSCYSDIVAETGYFFADELHFSTEQSSEMQAGLGLLKAFAEAITTLPDPLQGSDFNATLKGVGKNLGIKGKSLYHPIRLAITGREDGPELVKIAPLLGKAEVLKRLTLWNENITQEGKGL